MLFYMIFGTNLLTWSPFSVLVCFLVLEFRRKGIPMESKRNETFVMIFLGPEDIQRAWSAHQESHEAATWSGGEPMGVGRAPTLVGPS